jgi:ubiquinone/menaquinone biosynthesis C-methylase UbiE
MKSNKLPKERERIKNVYTAYMSDETFYKKWSTSNSGNHFISEERYKAIEKFLIDFDVKLHNKMILEVGCAGGSTISSLLRLGAVEENIHGIDIRSHRLNDAKKIYPNARFSIMDASELNFVGNNFDIVTTFTLFSSILDPEIRKQIASEIYRVLKPDGVVLYYDFRYNNPANKHVDGINKNEINHLFFHMKMTLKSITVLPPLSRKLDKMTSILYPALSKVPFLRSHYLGLFVK